VTWLLRSPCVGVLLFDTEPERKASAEPDLGPLLWAMESRTLDVTEETLDT
jgi:hypothetical protein